MNGLIKCLDRKLDDHIVTLKNIKDLDQNFKNLLNVKDSINYLNCENLNIKIASKFNFISLKNCSGISLDLNCVISGIEIIDSSNITIHGNCLNCVVAKNSSVVVYQPKNIRKKTLFESFKSSIKVLPREEV